MPLQFDIDERAKLVERKVRSSAFLRYEDANKCHPRLDPQSKRN